MTTHAPPQTSPWEEEEVRAPAVGATEPLTVGAAEPIVDSFALLDHRSQRRAIREGVAPAGHYLAFQHGAATKLLRLQSTITHLGRSLTSDVRFDDPRISRTHAIIARHGRYARVLDNRSHNGTFLNGRRILAGNLGHGDVVRMGPIAMQYLEVC